MIKTETAFEVYAKTWDKKDITKYFPVAFVGSCYGIGLDSRSKDDQHICFTVLVEDDETWFEKSNSHGSSFWLPELLECVQAATEWLKLNALEDIPKDWKRACGWKFKEIS